VIRYLIKSLLIVFEREHRKVPDTNSHLTSQYELQYLQFRELLEDNYKDSFSVSDYSDRLYISTKTLITITKAMVAKTPSHLIAERTILEAKRLLAFTALKVNEIGYKLGFDDPSYFVKFFKRHVKTSPSNYRALRT
jgi:AraC family transcriptional activator of pobA